MKSSYSERSVYTSKSAEVGKWQLKCLCINKCSTKTLYHVCQIGVTVRAIQ